MSTTDPRILILRLSSIGDILLSTPFIQQVRNRFKDGHISYIVKKEFADLLKENPHINELIKFDSSLGIAGLLDMAKDLKNNKYDIVFDLHNNMRTNRLTSAIKSSHITKIKKNKIKRAFLVYFKINLFNKVKTAAEKYLQTGERYSIEDNNEKLQLFFDGQTNETVELLLQNNDLKKKQYICIAPGAAHFTKIWPFEYMEKLIAVILQENKYKIVVLGGPKEKNILSAYESSKDVVSFCGETSLLESAGILKHSRGIISNDSGLMHMAAAVGVPLIALFGSTVEELGFFPYRANASILQVNNLWCRPCTHIGRSKCPLGHFNCMRQISVEQVLNEVGKKIY